MKIGNKVKLIEGRLKGETGYIVSINKQYNEVIIEIKSGKYTTYLDYIELLPENREESINVLKTEIEKLKENLKKKEIKLTRLEKYKDEKEEIADIIEQCIVAGRKENIYKILNESDIEIKINRKE